LLKAIRVHDQRFAPDQVLDRAYDKSVAILPITHSAPRGDDVDIELTTRFAPREHRNRRRPRQPRPSLPCQAARRDFARTTPASRRRASSTYLASRSIPQ
jgi:hypothetical protein